MTQSNFVQIGQRAWSYQTALMDVLPDGRTIGNDTKYSMTTSHHQSKARVRGCDIVVTDVPMGTENLAEWYMEQHPHKAAAMLAAEYWRVGTTQSVPVKE